MIGFMEKPKRDRREYNLKWAAENAERKKANHKRWRDANKDRIREYGKRYRAKDPEKFVEKALERSSKWRELNRERYLEQSKARYQMNAEKRRECSRRSRWKSLFLPEPTRPRPATCECCGSPPSGVHGLTLDHCHETGAFRGWLCGKCNRSIGQLGDNIASLERAIAYLKRSLNA